MTFSLSDCICAPSPRFACDFFLRDTPKPKSLGCDWFKYHPISLTCTDRAARANYIHLVMWPGFQVVNILWQHARPAAAATHQCSYIILQPRMPDQKHPPEYTLSQVATTKAWKMRSRIPRALKSLLLKLIIITLTLRKKKNSIRDDMHACQGVFHFLCLQVKEFDLFFLFLNVKVQPERIRWTEICWHKMICTCKKCTCMCFIYSYKWSAFCRRGHQKVGQTSIT